MNTRTIGLASDFWSLTKPRVVALIMLTACAGAALALLRHSADLPAVAITLVGIAMTAGAAAAFNHLVEIGADSVMRADAQPPPARRTANARTGGGVRPRPRRAGAFAYDRVWRGVDRAACRCDFFWLCRFVYAVSQAGDAAKYRHRRRVRRDAAGPRLGGGRRRHWL